MTNRIYVGVKSCETKRVPHERVVFVEVTGAKTVDARDDDQGFLDSNRKYLTRKEALDIAMDNGQIRWDRPIYDKLYSENLW